MQSEDRGITQYTTTKAHCKWCEEQGLGDSTDDVFDRQFQTTVEAMRKHEGKVYRDISQLQQEAKKADLPFDVEDCIQISNSLNHPAWANWGLIQSILAVIVLVVISANIVGQKPQDNKAFAGLSADKYGNVSGSLTMDLAGGKAVMRGVGTQQQLPIVFWHGTWQDELSMLRGDYDKCTWLKVLGDRVETPNSGVLYNQHAPELATSNSMRQLRDLAFRYYAAYGHYPETIEDLGQTSTYLNTIAGVREDFEIKQVVNGSIVSAPGRAQANDNHLSAMASKYSAHKPGAVWAVGVKSEPVMSADNNSYNWGSHSFYVYGADRDGHNLTMGADGRELILSLKNGKEVSNTMQASTLGNGSKIAFYTGEMPALGSIRGRYLIMLFGLLLMAAAVSIKPIMVRMQENEKLRLRGKRACV